ncbi:HutD family protein [Ramlibacter sp. H39-3-26]|uniref:HutD/Ves family protein n=1 Tax=Curvibacter soli TaxID=3031331 RepID=UPI0023DC6484|nr:HutD family protein [Ramlibacter sp. H39-3-26]MDF1486497.1 HutD family protein [Ramlibacter sp. H39-3-26]
MHRFDLAALPATPWKNGGGTTREIACWPPGAGLDAFDWRVSVATIAAGGPFSAFPGVERQIMLLDGAGVRLRSAHGAIDHALATPWQPFAFSGDAVLDCELLGGASSDLNLMARRGRVRGELRVLAGEARAINVAQAGVLLALRGPWRLAAGPAAFDCAPGQGVWWAGQALGWQARADGGDAALAVVRITHS